MGVEWEVEWHSVVAADCYWLLEEIHSFRKGVHRQVVEVVVWRVRTFGLLHDYRFTAL